MEMAGWHDVYHFPRPTKSWLEDIMADDISRKTQQDLAQVIVNEPYDVDYLAKKLNVSADQVRQA